MEKMIALLLLILPIGLCSVKAYETSSSKENLWPQSNKSLTKILSQVPMT